MAKRAQSLEAWLNRKHPGASVVGFRYNVELSCHEVCVVKRLVVPDHVVVCPEDEDKYEADERKHLLLPGIE